MSKYEELSKYFLGKLEQGLTIYSGKVQKEEKEKEDLVIFSILLLISRLIPSFQLVENSENKTVTTDEESKAVDTTDKQKVSRSRFETIDEYVRLIKAYSGNSTYFVRKISA